MYNEKMRNITNLRKFIKMDNGTPVIDIESLYEEGYLTEDQYDEFDDVCSNKKEQLEFFKPFLEKEGISWCYTYGFDNEPFADHGEYGGVAIPFIDYKGKNQKIVYIEESEVKQGLQNNPHYKIDEYDSNLVIDENYNEIYFVDEETKRWVDTSKYPKIDNYEVWFVQHISQ